MNRVNITNIENMGLEELRVDVHSESNLYRKDNICYKKFNFKDVSALVQRRKEKKIEIISKLGTIPHAIMPIDKLIEMINGRMLFTGYSMEFINGITLYNLCRNGSIELLLILLKAISKTLKQIHKNPCRIVFGDFNFHNILISNIMGSLDEIDYHFCDFDGIQIGNLTCERIPLITKDYSEYKEVRLKINKNYDRLSCLLSFLSLVFGKSILDTSMYEFDMECERLETLRELRSLVLEIKDIRKKNIEIPYMFEVISDKDIREYRKLRGRL